MEIRKGKLCVPLAAPRAMIVGNFGSGKTEVSVNLALLFAEQGKRVAIADLDIVNPYFRCREAKELLESRGIRVVVPPPTLTWSDLPVVMPEIKGMLDAPEGSISLFDVGGDDTGARLLSTLVEPLAGRSYELWQVINAKRPFTETVAGCLEMRRRIEAASRLRVTGLVGNTHLLGETTVEVVLEGLRLAQEVARQAQLPLVFVTAMEELVGAQSLDRLEVPVFFLRRYLLPPWLRRTECKADRPTLKPIGRP